MKIKSFLTLGVAATALMATDIGAAYAQIDEIIVTARKREESLQTVPVSVTAFSGEQFQRAGLQQASDIQYLTPNLRMEEQFSRPGGSNVQIRGQSQADVLLTTDASVGVYIDGVNLPRTTGLNANLFDVERIEVLKGPQGTLYGRNTTGGAINVISKKANHDGLSGFGEITVGRFDRLDYAAGVNIPVVEDKLAVRFSGQRNFDNGFGNNTATGTELGDKNEWFARGSLVFDPVDNFNATVIADWYQTDSGANVYKLLDWNPASAAVINAAVEQGALNPLHIPAAFNAFTPGPTFFSGLAAGNASLAAAAAGSVYDVPEDGITSDGLGGLGGESDGWGIGSTLTWDVSDITVKHISGFRKNQDSSRNHLDATPFTTLVSNFHTNYTFWSQELNVSGSAFGDRLTWLGGAFYSNEKGTDTSRTNAVFGINPANPSVLDGDVKNSSWAIYSENTLALTDSLDFTFGGRYTEETKELTSRNVSGGGFSGIPTSCNVAGAAFPNCTADFSDTFTGFSWLFGFDYQATDNVLLYAKTARGFRGGGQNLRGGSDPASFQSYRPEFARDVEVGMKSDWFDQRLRLNVAGFWTDYKDIQRSVIVPSTGGNIVTVLTNAAAATIYGFEVESVANPLDGLTFTAGVGLTDASYDSFPSIDPNNTAITIDRSDEPFPSTPKWQINLMGRYEHEMQQLCNGILGVQLGWYWQSEETEVITTTDPGFDEDLLNVDAYSLLSARVDFDIQDLGLEIAAFGNNLTNEEYRNGSQDLTSLGYFLASYGPPRTWGVTLTKRFN